MMLNSAQQGPLPAGHRKAKKQSMWSAQAVKKAPATAALSPSSWLQSGKRSRLRRRKPLGLQEVIFLRYPDQGLEDTPAFRKEIVRLIRTYRPATIVTADPYRRYIWHRDHRITGQVVLDAVFPYARDHLSYPDLLDEGLEPHKVQEVLLWASEDVNYRSDITRTFELKLAALRCHESQMKEFHVPDLAERLRQRCMEMAAGENFGLAEAFHQAKISM